MPTRNIGDDHGCGPILAQAGNVSYDPQPEAGVVTICMYKFEVAKPLDDAVHVMVFWVRACKSKHMPCIDRTVHKGGGRVSAGACPCSKFSINWANCAKSLTDVNARTSVKGAEQTASPAKSLAR